MIKNDVLLNEEIDPKLVSEITALLMEEDSDSLNWTKFVSVRLLCYELRLEPGPYHFLRFQRGIIGERTWNKTMSYSKNENYIKICNQLVLAHYALSFCPKTFHFPFNQSVAKTYRYWFITLSSVCLIDELWVALFLFQLWILRLGLTN